MSLSLSVISDAAVAMNVNMSVSVVVSVVASLDVAGTWP